MRETSFWVVANIIKRKMQNALVHVKVRFG